MIDPVTALPWMNDAGILVAPAATSLALLSKSNSTSSPTALSASRIVRARAARSVGDHWCGRNSLRARALTTDAPGECEHVVRRARRTGGSHHVSFATPGSLPHLSRPDFDR